MPGPLFYDRIKESTTSTGTPSVALAGAQSGFQGFGVVGSGNICYYAIQHRTADEWEVGLATVPDSGVTLARTRVLDGSSGTLWVNLSAGTKDVFLTLPSASLLTPHPIVFVEDDFVSGIFVDGQIGALGWDATTQTGSGFVAGTAQTGHPGILRLNGAAAATASIILAPAATMQFHTSNDFDMLWIVNASSGAGGHIRLGFRDDDGTDGQTAPTNGIYFEFIPGSDTNWFGVTNDGAGSTRTDMSVAFSSGSWVGLRIRKSGSTVYFSINDGAEVSTTLNIISAAAAPFAHAGNSTSNIADVDYFSLRVTGLARY